ncbi:MAG: hypothetical protein ACYDEX_07935 [Mobilitalea sp.]
MKTAFGTILTQHYRVTIATQMLDLAAFPMCEGKFFIRVTMGLDCTMLSNFF